MSKQILILQGHPHPGPHFCHALADAYAKGAAAAGHQVARLEIAALDFGVLRDPRDFLQPPPPPIQAAQEAVRQARHMAIFYPLWLGTMPALVKAFFEQLACGGFLLKESKPGEWPKKQLAGRSARVIVPMGMPANAYRLIFGAAGVRGFESGILGIAGFAPVRETLIGLSGGNAASRARWLARMEALGAKAA